MSSDRDHTAPPGRERHIDGSGRSLVATARRRNCICECNVYPPVATRCALCERSGLRPTQAVFAGEGDCG